MKQHKYHAEECRPPCCELKANPEAAKEHPYNGEKMFERRGGVMVRKTRNIATESFCQDIDSVGQIRLDDKLVGRLTDFTGIVFVTYCFAGVVLIASISVSSSHFFIWFSALEK